MLFTNQALCLTLNKIIQAIAHNAQLKGEEKFMPENYPISPQKIYGPSLRVCAHALFSLDTKASIRKVCVTSQYSVYKVDFHNTNLVLMQCSNGGTRSVSLYSGHSLVVSALRKIETIS